MRVRLPLGGLHCLLTTLVYWICGITSAITLPFINTLNDLDLKNYSLGLNLNAFPYHKNIIAIEKCTFSAFPIQKPEIPNLTSPWNIVNQGHHLYKCCCTKVPDDTYQISCQSAPRFFLRFLPYMGMAAFLVMWPAPNMNILFPFAKNLHMKFNWNCSCCFREVHWKCWLTMEATIP